MTGAGMGAGPSNDEKVMAGVAYLGSCIFWIPTIVIFLMKKDESTFIKFHCLQCFGMAAVGVAMMIISIPIGILSNIPVIGWIGGLLSGLIMMLIGLALTGYWIYLTIKAFQGEETEIPILGSIIREKFMD